MIGCEGLGPSPGQRVLASGEVHVWKSCLDRSLHERECWFTLLSAEEKERAASYHRDQDRSHFVCGRGMLRALLSSYLHIPPNDLAFGYESKGKPYLLTPDCDLHFNVSHSNGVALYALTRANRVGVDIEYMRTNLDTERIAGRFFARSEAAALQALPEEERRLAFFRCWTRKESYVKAVGDGLALSFDQFAVSVAAASGLLTIQRGSGKASKWRLEDLCAAPGYTATVATDAPSPQIRFWEYA